MTKLSYYVSRVVAENTFLLKIYLY